jgi:hypothetical protein
VRLISFDSTIRSNLSVGTPLDLLVYQNHSFHVSSRRRLFDDDPYFNMIRSQWSEGLQQVLAQLPPPPDPIIGNSFLLMATSRLELICSPLCRPLILVKCARGQLIVYKP